MKPEAQLPWMKGRRPLLPAVLLVALFVWVSLEVASSFVPPPACGKLSASSARRTRLSVAAVEAKAEEGLPVEQAMWQRDSKGPRPWMAGLLGAAGGVALAEAGSAPWRPSAVVDVLLQHHGSFQEDLFLGIVILVSVYCLVEMAFMQMHCKHLEARIHTTCNALAAVFSLYGIGMERLLRESPGLWWGLLTPLLYLVSNFTMTRLMSMYKGPQAYKRLFELGQSFTLSFQGIHLLAWSSLYPALYWAALPFWYWSLKKLIEPMTYMIGVVTGENASRVEDHKERDASWGAFGLELDAMTLGFMLANFAAAIADNAYMGTYTLRGPEGFFEASRELAATAGWGSDHLRMALVKPAAGSLVVSMSVFLGTLVSRNRLPLAVGVPASVLLSTLFPWLVFFWHRLVDPGEPWLPEILGQSWGPGPLGQLFGA